MGKAMVQSRGLVRLPRAARERNQNTIDPIRARRREQDPIPGSLGSLVTRRWRELDSNFQFRAR
jgi:hypothetical protein